MFRNGLSVLVSLFIVTQLSFAQVTTGTISGVVRDSTGAIIPGVGVTVRNLDTGIARNVVTNEQGRYQALSLSLGNYEVQTEKEGFQSEVRRGIVLTVGRQAVVNFDLQVGAVTQTVEVTGEAPLVETTSSSVAALVETAQIESLPLNGRSFDELALLQPGITIAKFQSPQIQGGFTTKISIRGARPEQNNFLLDGTDVRGPANQIPGSVAGRSLGVDAVREFRVETTTFSAQYGSAAGGVINVITKSGTNEFHGTVFEFLRNDNLDARNFFDLDPANPSERSDPPEFKRNQFGFSLGGPVLRDKTFFFGAYEGVRDRLGQTLFATVPTAEARQGRLPDPRTGRIQQITVKPAVKPYLDLWPLPTPGGRDFGNGTAEHIRGASRPTDENYFTVRADHNFSASDSFFSRYTFDHATRSESDSVGVLNEESRTRNQFLTLEQTHIFSPSLLNTSRFGFNRSFSSIIPVATGVAESLLNELALIPGRSLFLSGSLLDPGSGISSIGTRNTPRIWAWNLFEWAEDVNYTTATHSVKAGVLIKRMQFNMKEALNAGGVASFGSLQDFLLGRARAVDVLKPGVTQAGYWRYNYFGWYVQDDIRIHPHLTLNLGLRHEFLTGPREKFGNFCNLDNLFGDFQCGGPVFPTRITTKNFGPRVGFAWDAFGTGKTSVRGGFGIYYDNLPPLWWQASGSTQPPITRFTIQPAPFPEIHDLIVAGSGDVRLSPTPNGWTATPSTLQYSLTLQQQFTPSMVFSAGYVGSLGRHLWTRGQENIVEPFLLPDGRKFFPEGGVRRRPDLAGQVRYTRTQANSTYSGMILTLQRRFSQGLQLQATYTLSKSMDTGSNVTNTSNAPGSTTLLDPYDWKRDRSLSDFDARHNLTFNSTWELPFGPGKAFGSGLSGAAAKIVEGWQMGGLVKVSSVSPLTVSHSANRSRDGTSDPSDRPDLVPGRSNNPVLGSPDKWFDPSAFQLQERGFYGNLGRNTLSGPDQVTVDFSVMKNLGLSGISENFRLQFRAEFFNILNRVNFGAPSTSLTDRRGDLIPSVGIIRKTTTTSRQIQFGLKFIW